MGRKSLKLLVRGAFLIPLFPLALLTAFGRIRSMFSFFAHFLALVPGTPGNYMRTAYYVMTLRQFSILSTTHFGTFFAHPDTTVAAGVDIGAYCVLGRSQIGERTRLASHVQLLSGQNQHVRDAEGKLTGSGPSTQITIGADCWIGAGAIVMADLGESVTIGAGAVVGMPVPSGAVASGNPARTIKTTTAVSKQ
jgi:virginiamycin A acetyltransferase